MLRIATKNDNTALCQLWQQAFNEDSQIADFVFNDFSSFDNIYVCEQESTVVAMIVTVEVECKNKKGVYFYGVSTRKEWKKQGIMSRLMEFAQTDCRDNGYDFVVLIPSSDELFDFYGKRGYETQFQLREFSHKVKNNVFVDAKFDTITAKSLRELRNKYIKSDRISLNPKSEIATVIDMYRNSAITVENDFGYGIFYKQNEVMFFDEIFSVNTHRAEELLQAAKQYYGCEQAKGLVAQGTDLFLGEGKAKPFGMIMFLNEKFELDFPYMNMMLN